MVCAFVVRMQQSDFFFIDDKYVYQAMMIFGSWTNIQLE